MQNNTTTLQPYDWQRGEGQVGQLCWCIHHGILVEVLSEPDINRVNYINRYKPENEKPLRLYAFRPIKNLDRLPLPVKEALEQLNKALEQYTKASEQRNKLWEQYIKARKQFNKAKEKYDKACEQYDKAWEQFNKARKQYTKAREQYLKAVKQLDKARDEHFEELYQLFKEECPLADFDKDKGLVF